MKILPGRFAATTVLSMMYVGLGCGPGALDRGVATTASGAKVYQNNLWGSELHAYSLGWPAGTHVTVRVQADSPLHLSAESIYENDAQNKPLGNAQPSKSASFSFEVPESAQEVRIRLEMPDAMQSAHYVVAFEPAPLSEHKVPREGPTKEARVEAILRDTKPSPAFASTDLERVKKELSGYEKVSTTTVALDQAGPWVLEVPEGYQYAAVVRLTPGAVFSPIAQRGVVWHMGEPRGHRSQTNPIVSGSIVLHTGLTKGKDGHLAVSVLPTSCMTCGLGSGNAEVELYRRGGAPALQTKEKFVQKRTEATKGYTLAKSWKGNLESVEPLSLALADGVCRVLVIELAPNAKWASSVRGFSATMEHGAVPQSPDNGLSLKVGAVVGPGAVADFGCLGSGNTKITFAPSTEGAAALGVGEYTASLYTRALSSAELLKERCGYCRSAHPAPSVTETRYSSPTTAQKAAVAYERLKLEECAASFAKRTSCD